MPPKKAAAKGAKKGKGGKKSGSSKGPTIIGRIFSLLKRVTVSYPKMTFYRRSRA
jgi:hypothetical protein